MESMASPLAGAPPTAGARPIEATKTATFLSLALRLRPRHRRGARCSASFDPLPLRLQPRRSPSLSSPFASVSSSSHPTEIGGGSGGDGAAAGYGGGGGGGGETEGKVDLGVVDGFGDGDVIVLRVGGMSCRGCAGKVKRLLESQPEVSSATVDLEKETAFVWAVPEVMAAQDWKQQLGEKLAHHLTTCGFTSELRGNPATEGEEPKQ